MTTNKITSKIKKNILEKKYYLDIYKQNNLHKNIAVIISM